MYFDFNALLLLLYCIKCNTMKVVKLVESFNTDNRLLTLFSINMVFELIWYNLVVFFLGFGT